MAKKTAKPRRRARRPVKKTPGWSLRVETDSGIIRVLGDKPFVIKLSTAFHQELRRVAYHRHEYTTMQDLIAEALRKWWRSRRQKVATKKAAKETVDVGGAVPTSATIQIKEQ